MATDAAYYRLKRTRQVVSKPALTYPITVAGEEVDELWLTRLTLKPLRGIAYPQMMAGFQAASGGEGGEFDFARLPSDTVDTLVVLLAHSAGITEAEAECVDPVDLFTLLLEVVGFLSPSGD